MPRSLRERIDAFPFQLTMTIVWIVMVPTAIVTGWLWSIGFIAACSIYANAIGHWSAHRAERAEKAHDPDKPNVNYDMPPAHHVSDPLEPHALWRDTVTDYASAWGGDEDDGYRGGVYI